MGKGLRACRPCPQAWRCPAQCRIDRIEVRGSAPHFEKRTRRHPPRVRPPGRCPRYSPRPARAQQYRQGLAALSRTASTAFSGAIQWLCERKAFTLGRAAWTCSYPDLGPVGADDILRQVETLIEWWRVGWKVNEAGSRLWAPGRHGVGIARRGGSGWRKTPLSEWRPDELQGPASRQWRGT